jgi:hypothetical protein
MRFLIIILAFTSTILAQDFIPWFGTTVTYPDNYLQPNLFAQYKFDGVGGDAADSTNSYTLTAVGAPGSTASGKISRARIIDPVGGNFFYAADDPAWEIGVNDYTISFWINMASVPADGQYATIISKWNLTTGIGSWFIYAVQDTGGVGSGFGVAASLDGTNLYGNEPRAVLFEEDGITQKPLLPNVWYFVCARFNYTGQFYTMIIYDELGNRFTDFKEFDYTAGIYDSTAPLMIGGYASGAATVSSSQAMAANTLIDELGFWQRHLSECEVGKLFSPVPRDYYNSITCVE